MTDKHTGQGTTPVNEHHVEWRERVRGNSIGFRWKQLGATAGSDALGCSLYEVYPGKRSWPYHYHLANEEALYVLAGDGRLRTFEGSFPLEPGDYVAFPVGEASAHQVVNPGSTPLRYLCFSEMNHPDVVKYPDSEKLAVFGGDGPRPGAADEGFERVFETVAAVEYWRGEPPMDPE